MSTDKNQTPPLSILLWNANGLTHNKNELQHLLNDKKMNIALITETHLTPPKHFSIPGYTTYTEQITLTVLHTLVPRF